MASEKKKKGKKKSFAYGQFTWTLCIFSVYQISALPVDNIPKYYFKIIENLPYNFHKTYCVIFFTSKTTFCVI